ncbi:MAG TPA: RNA polymerase sigma factor [Pyrinomonadaceae bacterium]|jgi:RNA polymerase sigma-70 factor (ECF subfamily)
MVSEQAIRLNQPVNTGLTPEPSRIALAEGTLHYSDYVLAREAATGSARAVRDLYERHHQRVYALCLRMTGNGADAEDLTQEVFVHVMRKVGLFRGESRFTTWLYRLTVNVVLMRFRHWKIRPEQQMPDNFDSTISAVLRNRQSASARIADRLALDSALAQLAPGCRSVFVLFDVEGYQHREIARLLGCTTGTSKSQLHRARKKLKRLLTSR